MKALLIVAALIASAPWLSSAETIRIAAFSLRVFGDAKANDPARLDFIADRIAEQAVKGLCVVDELKDADGSALNKLEAAVSASAHMAISAVFSLRVGSGSAAEQFGYFWNPQLMDITGPVATILFDEIERDPGVATFKAAAGFDFTVCAFHTRPDSQAAELKAELAFLDDVFKRVQDQNIHENDIIFVGDFNAPPSPLPDQALGILTEMGHTSVNFRFAITDRPTNLRQTKTYDNIIADADQTVEFVTGPQHVVPIFEMLDEFVGTIPDSDQIGWFLSNVVDHCPVYAVFRADLDTD